MVVILILLFLLAIVLTKTFFVLAVQNTEDQWLISTVAFWLAVDLMAIGFFVPKVFF